MKTLINNLLIPFFDFKSFDFKSFMFDNSIIPKSWLVDKLVKSKDLLKKNDICIEKIQIDDHIINLVNYCDQNLLNITKVCAGNWKIDKAFIYSINSTSKGQRMSELPHHDSVGVRLKIFIGLDEEPNVKIFNRVYNLKPNFISNYNCDENQRKKWNDIIEKQKIDYNDLIVSQDRFGIFNTNYIHEGIVLGSGQRNLIVVEISNLAKSSMIFGKIGGKI